MEGFRPTINVLPQGPFTTISSDPPWWFDNQGTRAATDNHYERMPTAEIAMIDVASVAAKDAHLYLWTTAAHLMSGEALMVARAWDFRPVMPITWAKVNDEGKLQMGLGNYWRHCTEICLFCTRGKASKLVQAHDQLNLFWSERDEHSAKPPLFYDLVQRVSPGPYLEMFARAPRLGWTVWGKQADGLWRAA